MESSKENCNTNCEVFNKPENNVINKCNEWLSNCNVSDFDSLSVGCSDLATTTTTATSNSSTNDNDLIFSREDVNLDEEIVEAAQNADIFNRTPLMYENVKIYRSKRVHIGDIIYVNHNKPTINQQTITAVTNNCETKPGNNFRVINRTNWLAQPPMELPTLLQEAAKHVIISHSATEEAHTQADNTLIVRLIQTFHIESRKWSDIAYNFLVGADGCLFEGRGWRVVGAHTHNYNSSSVGICFIGCFMKHLPPPVALRNAKALIQHGVEIGAIAADYKLLAHRQCSSTESPGEALFEEVKMWDRWDGSVDLNNPSPEIIA